MGLYSRSVAPQTEHAKAEEGAVEGGGEGDWIGEEGRFGIAYFWILTTYAFTVIDAITLIQPSGPSTTNRTPPGCTPSPTHQCSQQVTLTEPFPVHRHPKGRMHDPLA